MRRSFLDELNIDKETISAIMKEYGTSVADYKAEIDEYRTEVNTLKSSILDQDKIVEDSLTKYREEIKEQLDKANSYDDVFNQLQDYKAKEESTNYSSVVETFLKDNKIEFNNKYAQDFIMKEFNNKEFKLNEDNLFGEEVNTYFNELKELHNDAFMVTEVSDEEETVSDNVDKSPYKPTPGSGTNNLIDQVLSNF